MDWFENESSFRDENADAHRVAPKRRVSKRQVLASLENLPSDPLDIAEPLSFKILVIGNSKCGKTSIIRRYASDSFTEDYNITLGADYTKKVVEWGKNKEQQIRLQLWDIAGQDRFALLTRPYFRNASAAVIVCDVTRPLTLEAVREWKRELDEKMSTEGAEIPCILLANKCDQLKGVQEALEIGARIENICSELGFAKWFITSAKSNENITDAMTFLLTVLTKPKSNICKADSLTSHRGSVTTDSRRSSLKLGNGNMNHPAAVPVNITPVSEDPRNQTAEGGGCSLA